jgi:(p)ppGpp synthase/HD superfamily hydrolase
MAWIGDMQYDISAGAASRLVRRLGSGEVQVLGIPPARAGRRHAEPPRRVGAGDRTVTATVAYAAGIVLVDRFPSFVSELPLTRRALAFAASRHADQRREADQARFILHPLEVAQLLRGRDYPDAVIAAAVLHDVVEDTRTELGELEREFGAHVCRLVAAVTEPVPLGPYPERKERLRAAVADAGPEALAIYAADKVAKARELRLRLARDPDALPDREKLEHYDRSLSLLEDRLGGHPLVDQLRFELETLALLPPRGS